MVLLSSIDLVVAVVACLVLAVSLLVGVMLIDTFSAQPELSGEVAYLAQAKSAILALDSLVAVIVVGVCLSSLILAFLIRSHPAFFIVSFLITLVLIPISGMMGNIYEQFATDSHFASAANQLPLQYYVFEYLPKVTAVFAALIAVVMYGKAQSPYGVG